MLTSWDVTCHGEPLQGVSRTDTGRYCLGDLLAAALPERSMYIYIYTYICMYVCVCVYVCMYINIYISCMYVCMYVCIYQGIRNGYIVT